MVPIPRRGIIMENDCVLFAGNANEDYLYSIGGAVQMGEKARDAAIREVHEETHWIPISESWIIIKFTQPF